MRVVPEAIQEEFARLPSDMAFWNARYAEAYRRWLEAKQERETMHGRRYQELRDQLLAAGHAERGIVADTERSLEIDDVLAVAVAAEIDAEVRKVRLWGVLDALRTKRDMLVSLGAHMRAEMGSGLNEGDR